MKHFVLFMVLGFLTGWFGYVWAQDTMSTNAPTPTAKKAVLAGNPAVDEIRIRMKEQRKQINAGLKSRKLSPEDAKVLTEKVRMVGQQIKVNYQQDKQNGQKGLPDEQVLQLNRMLDENSLAMKNQTRVVGIAPSAVGSNPPPSESLPAPKPITVAAPGLPAATVTDTAAVVSVQPIVAPGLQPAPVSDIAPVTSVVPVVSGAPLPGTAPDPGGAPKPGNAPLPGSAPKP